MAFDWKCEPEAEKVVLDLLGTCQRQSPAVVQLAQELHLKTSTRLFDWLDYVICSSEAELQEKGFEAQIVRKDYKVYHHPSAQLPRIVVKEGEWGVAVRVEHISDFLMVRGMHREIEGSLLSGFRRSQINKGLYVVERRATFTVEPTYERAGYVENYLQAKELWKSRERSSLDEALCLGERLVDRLGQDLAAHVIIEAEREYWQSRNRAAQVQKARQDAVGMGWANHDHHTFRAARRNFVKTIRFFEMLGFHCRERFNPGMGAGWGGQVLENPRAGLVLFTDMDMAPHEHEIDFAHIPLPELEKLGTTGLWCELHGDSLLQAGMHHVEAQFEFDNLREDLKPYQVNFMNPFSHFNHLKQAFSEGEIWPIDPQTIERLAKEGKISQEQAQKFKIEGAVGSHLENLQRREGFKGFNQQNITDILSRTDPRTYTNA